MKNELPDLLNVVKALVTGQATTMSALSRAMKKDHTYVNRNLHKRDPTVGFVTELSTMLGTNLFELYGQNLPPDLRATDAERALRAELEAMSKELERVKAENEKLWGAVTGRKANG